MRGGLGVWGSPGSFLFVRFGFCFFLFLFCYSVSFFMTCTCSGARGLEDGVEEDTTYCTTFPGARSAAFSSLRRLRVRLRCQHRAGATSALAARELAVVAVPAALVPLEFPLARALAALVHFRGVLDRPRIEASPVGVAFVPNGETPSFARRSFR